MGNNNSVIGDESSIQGKTYGYIRVSTAAQRDDRQWLAMDQFGVPRDAVFVDKQSGKNFARPAYKKLMEKLQTGDTLVIKSLDRLGRNYDEMMEQLHIITKEKEAAIVVLDMPLLDTRKRYGDDLTGKLITDIVIQIFSYVAQMEREMNHQRTMEGIAAARARGVRFGRRPMKRPPEFEVVREQWMKKRISARGAARQLGIALSTFRRWVNE